MVKRMNASRGHSRWKKCLNVTKLAPLTQSASREMNISSLFCQEWLIGTFPLFILYFQSVLPRHDVLGMDCMGEKLSLCSGASLEGSRATSQPGEAVHIGNQLCGQWTP